MGGKKAKKDARQVLKEGLERRKESKKQHKQSATFAAAASHATRIAAGTSTTTTRVLPLSPKRSRLTPSPKRGSSALPPLSPSPRTSNTNTTSKSRDQFSSLSCHTPSVACASPQHHTQSKSEFHVQDVLSEAVSYYQEEDDESSDNESSCSDDEEESSSCSSSASSTAHELESRPGKTQVSEVSSVSHRLRKIANIFHHKKQQRAERAADAALPPRYYSFLQNEDQDNNSKCSKNSGDLAAFLEANNKKKATTSAVVKGAASNNNNKKSNGKGKMSVMSKSKKSVMSGLNFMEKKSSSSKKDKKNSGKKDKKSSNKKEKKTSNKKTSNKTNAKKVDEESIHSNNKSIHSHHISIQSDNRKLKKDKKKTKKDKKKQRQDILLLAIQESRTLSTLGGGIDPFPFLKGEAMPAETNTTIKDDVQPDTIAATTTMPDNGVPILPPRPGVKEETKVDDSMLFLEFLSLDNDQENNNNNNGGGGNHHASQQQHETQREEEVTEEDDEEDDSETYTEEYENDAQSAASVERQASYSFLQLQKSLSPTMRYPLSPTQFRDEDDEDDVPGNDIPPMLEILSNKSSPEQQSSPRPMPETSSRAHSPRPNETHSRAHSPRPNETSVRAHSPRSTETSGRARSPRTKSNALTAASKKARTRKRFQETSAAPENAYAALVASASGCLSFDSQTEPDHPRDQPPPRRNNNALSTPPKRRGLNQFIRKMVTDDDDADDDVIDCVLCCTMEEVQALFRIPKDYCCNLPSELRINLKDFTVRAKVKKGVDHPSAVVVREDFSVLTGDSTTRTTFDTNAALRAQRMNQREPKLPRVDEESEKSIELKVEAGRNQAEKEWKHDAGHFEGSKQQAQWQSQHQGMPQVSQMQAHALPQVPPQALSQMPHQALPQMPPQAVPHALYQAPPQLQPQVYPHALYQAAAVQEYHNQMLAKALQEEQNTNMATAFQAQLAAQNQWNNAKGLNQMTAEGSRMIEVQPGAPRQSDPAVTKVPEVSFLSESTVVVQKDESGGNINKNTKKEKDEATVTTEISKAETRGNVSVVSKTAASVATKESKGSKTSSKASKSTAKATTKTSNASNNPKTLKSSFMSKVSKASKTSASTTTAELNTVASIKSKLSKVSEARVLSRASSRVSAASKSVSIAPTEASVMTVASTKRPDRGDVMSVDRADLMSIDETNVLSDSEAELDTKTKMTSRSRRSQKSGRSSQRESRDDESDDDDKDDDDDDDEGSDDEGRDEKEDKKEKEDDKDDLESLASMSTAFSGIDTLRGEARTIASRRTLNTATSRTLHTEASRTLGTASGSMARRKINTAQIVTTGSRRDAQMAEMARLRSRRRHRKNADQVTSNDDIEKARLNEALSSDSSEIAYSWEGREFPLLANDCPSYESEISDLGDMIRDALSRADRTLHMAHDSYENE